MTGPEQQPKTQSQQQAQPKPGIPTQATQPSAPTALSPAPSAPPAAPPVIPASVRQHYLRKEVLEKIFSVCQDREIGPVFYASQYGKRPQSVQFVGDLEQMARQGATSFHGSVELWKNPLALSSSSRKQDMDEMRKGWDLIIDIDSDLGLEYGREAAILVMKTFKAFGINHHSIKFSGRRGWHIGVSHKSFPDEINYRKTRLMYPELMQSVASYLRHVIKERLAEKLLSMNPDLEKIMAGGESAEGKAAGKKSRNVDLKTLDPFKVLDIEQNWGPRHLFRLPYSFNEKTWLVSIPVDPEELMSFDREQAKPENVKPKLGFLDSFGENEAEDLILEAIDFSSEQKSAEKLALSVPEGGPKRREGGFAALMQPIPEIAFPPCIKLMLKGLSDGRKRSVFILINFLRTCGWSWEDVEKELYAWNDRNPEPLRRAYVSGQIMYARKRKETALPPNCEYKGYYDDIKVCVPDSLCAKIKNPVSYAIARSRPEKGKRKTSKPAKPSVVQKQ